MEAAMSRPVIRTRDLTKRYRRAAVLDGLNLEIPSGSIYALVGPNGAGKTTTIKILMNLLSPSSGSSTVLDTESHRLSSRDFAQIGYVSENQELPNWMTVGYYLDYLSTFYPTWDRSLSESLLKQFQLPCERKLKHLSHGMRMKTMLAAALAFRPRLMVLDEPFTGLDAMVRDELVEGILTRGENTTIFISSHELTEVESFATHIGFLDYGRLQFSEELGTLSARFREVVVTFSGEAPPLPDSWPATWLRPQRTGSVVRFLETQFREDRELDDIRRLFPNQIDISLNPASLRSIFVGLAKSSREAI